MNRLTRASVGLAVAASIGGSTVACGTGADVYERPTYMGANGQCYVLDASDLYYLQHAGLCPIGWVPAPMPGWFETQYYGAIQHQYVTVLPSARQKTVIKVVNNYGDQHKSDVQKAQSGYTAKVQKAADVKAQQSSTSTYKANNGDSKTSSTTPKVNTSRQQSSTSTYRSSSSSSGRRP